MKQSSVVEKMHWLGHDGIRIDADQIIYFDPYQISSGVAADILLITHEHYDHCSIDDVKKVLGPETMIVTEKDSAAKLNRELGEALAGKITTMSPGETVTVKGVKITAVPAYNTNKDFHPKENGWLGFLVDLQGETVYHAGDTDKIPEMADISCDIALLPVSGTYVMTAAEAVDAALKIHPRIAIPMHYGSLVGDDADAATFKSGLEGKIDVKVLEKNN